MVALLEYVRPELVALLEYVRPELFDEAVERHHRSYVSAVLGRSPGNIQCRTTRTLMSIHQRWIPKYVIHIYYLFRGRLVGCIRPIQAYGMQLTVVW
jgi:hypothetical protein